MFTCLPVCLSGGRVFCPPTLVEGDYSNGFVRPSIRQSVDTILSPQLFLQVSKDFDLTFQILLP